MKPPLPGDISAVSRDAILAQLGKILASTVFQGAERSTKLLRYLVEQTANGRTNGLKEYTLGADVLGKGSSFDPRTDTIVRAEASRLRNRLERYYAAEGQADPLVITLPKGSYVPRFETQTAAPDRPTARGKGPQSRSERFTWFALGLGVAACLSVFIAWTSWRSPQPVASVRPDTAVSIAVLPFVNISGDSSQDFFSDGITEEITSVLARVPDLQVVGRTSAFQFKGESKDLRAIGQALGATHLIEGSVRKDGNRVRITAQLVQADNGIHVWAETYDRELTGVFAIQEDIAKAIAASMRTPLGLKPGETLIVNRIADPDVYEQYLRGRVQLRTRTFPATYETLEGLVARAPEFAPGWATLANAYSVGTSVAPRRGEYKLAGYLRDKAEAAARKAIQLDADYAGGYSALASTQGRRGKWAEVEDLYKQALALDPNDPEVLQGYSGYLAVVGHLKEALRVRERLRALEPLVPIYNQITARVMQSNGQIDASIAILEPDPSNNPQRNVNLAEAYAIKGRFADAADTLLRITQQLDRGSVDDAAQLLRSAPSKTDAPAKLPTLDAELGFVYAYIGAPERMLEYPEQAAKEGIFGQLNIVWRPSAASARKTERFKSLMRRAGLVDYWRARGWPDLCRPMGADDFVCD